MVLSSSTFSFRRWWPNAALLSVLGCLALSTSCYLSVRYSADDDGPLLLYAGDSRTGNYRFAPGDRLQDLTPERIPEGWLVHNYAWPGARPLDILLQIQKAETLLGHVDRVVVPLSVSRFRVGDPYLRLDKRGDNLKWLHADSLSLPTLETLDHEHKKNLLIHKLGLLMGFYDWIELMVVKNIQWPHEREIALNDPPKRRAKINAKTRRRATQWDTVPINPESFLESPAARDMDLLVDYLDAQSIPLLIVWLPVGNMDAVAATFSEKGRARLEEVRRLAVQWSRSRGVDHIDLVHSFKGEHYDDFTHLKTREGNQVIVDAVANWFATPQEASNLTATPTPEMARSGF